MIESLLSHKSSFCHTKVPSVAFESICHTKGQRHTKGHSEAFFADIMIAPIRTVTSARVVPARIRSAAGRLPARPALARQPRFQRLGPAQAAALRATHTVTARRPWLVPRLSSQAQPLSLGYGAGNARAVSAAPVLTIPPSIPTQAAASCHSTEPGLRALPSHRRPLAPARLAPKALAAPPHQCPHSGPTPSVHSPLLTYDSALCSESQRAQCLPNHLGSSFRTRS